MKGVLSKIYALIHWDLIMVILAKHVLLDIVLQ